jgi:hypothetical protein
MTSNTMSHQLPVLDIATPNQEVARHLVDTVAKYGFVYIQNRGLSLPGSDIDSMFTLVNSLGFNVPDEFSKG